MKKQSLETNYSNETSRNARNHSLQKLFKHHGDQFLKWNFLPFLHHDDRTSLRAVCKAINNFVPAPNFVYVKHRTIPGTARLEKVTGYVETQ